MMNRKTERLIDQIAFQTLAGAYAFYFNEYNDHRRAMQSTCKMAIREGFVPAACWVSTAQLAAGRPTHSVAFTKGQSSALNIVFIGGVSILSELDVIYDHSQNIHAGWKLIDKEGAELYRQWASQVQPNEVDYQVGS
ncbi:Uncharacterised protein [Pseudomonas luteola]|uniref:Uncharacterized protein n=1 Tax=Pseudomonas luteola TaxID=47886 RepID=A0A2X2CCT5_PSELU|nr:hypothetical protein [Pseudomonas luteola]MCG7374338.1 hypothetical protein [Pseudomonas luteola]SPZ04943.1 Uncharacterised protein [Pseudomonas luteola]